MTQKSDFLARLRLPQTLPETITSLRFDVTYTVDATSRGVPEQIRRDLEWSLEEAEPLFAAGFAAVRPDGDSTRDIKLSLKVDQGNLQLSVKNAAHRSMMAYCLLRLIEQVSSTPPDAYRYLRNMMDGDEEAAKTAYNPKHVTDIASVTCTAGGIGAEFPFSYDQPPLLPVLEPLATQISDEEPLQQFALPSEGRLSEAVDHGFLVMQNNGVFLDASTQNTLEEEPEIFLSAPREVSVSRWEGPGFALAELLWLIAGGRAEGIVRVNAN